MSRFAILVAALASSSSVFAQTYSNTFGVYTITQDTGEDVPLASKHFQWPDLPYQADSGDGPRGTQQGPSFILSLLRPPAGAHVFTRLQYL